MRTANNTNNYTVEGLVAKYRNFIKENCPKELVTYLVDNKIIEDKVPNEFGAIETLLLSLYKSVAGNNVNHYIVEALEKYVSNCKENYANAFTDDEYAFLANHFSEFLDYIIPSFPEILSKQSRIELIKQYLYPKDGATIFFANTGCDVACLFPSCKVEGYFDTEEYPVRWAIGQILLFSKGIHSDIQPVVFYESTGYSVSLPQEGSVDYIVYGAHEDVTYDDILSLYRMLAPNGRMLVFADMKDMHGKDEKYQHLRKVLIEEKAISSIIAFKDTEPLLKGAFNHILLVIDKEENNSVEMVSLSSDRKTYVDYSCLTPDCLWPSYYMTTRPDVGISLSNLATCPSRKEDFAKFKEQIGRFQYEDIADVERLVLPDWMLNLSIATAADLSVDFKDANLSDKVLLNVSDSSFNLWRGRVRVVEQPCVLLAAEFDTPHKLHVGYYDKVAEKRYARVHGMPCVFPKEGIDVRYLAALLFMPEVRNQIMSLIDNNHLFDFDFGLLLDLVAVSNHNEMEREKFLTESFCNALSYSQKELKGQHEQYRKAVRMRKHALTQSLSSVKSMFNALNNYRNLHNGNISDNELISRVKGTTVKEAFEFIDKNIKDMMPALEHIADVEYSFNKPEWINPERFVEDYITKKGDGWLNFRPTITWEKGHNQAKGDLKDPFTGQLILKKGDAVNMLLFPTDALERVFNNIVSNAQAHGFTDSSRKDYELRFSWHTDGIALIVEIENNGTAIPSDRDTASLLEYGVSSALHQNGHNGIGCNEIDDIMQKYDGKVELVSSPENEFTVKYVLTFNRSNIVKSINF